MKVMRPPIHNPPKPHCFLTQHATNTDSLLYTSDAADEERGVDLIYIKIIIKLEAIGFEAIAYYFYLIFIFFILPPFLPNFVVSNC